MLRKDVDRKRRWDDVARVSREPYPYSVAWLASSKRRLVLQITGGGESRLQPGILDD